MESTFPGNPVTLHVTGNGNSLFLISPPWSFAEINCTATAYELLLMKNCFSIQSIMHPIKYFWNFWQPPFALWQPKICIRSPVGTHIKKLISDPAIVRQYKWKAMGFGLFNHHCVLGGCSINLQLVYCKFTTSFLVLSTQT